MIAKAEGDYAPISYISVEEIDRENFRAYDCLASEYDEASHLTTRKLENASISGFKKLLDFFTAFKMSSILEIGCGTGALTLNILNELDVHSLHAIDISRKMIEVSKRKICKAQSQHSAHFETISILMPSKELLKRRYDLVFCGLADPYLIPIAIRNISEVLAENGLVFFSLPEKNWTEIERGKRIGIPANRTRFSLKNDTYVYCYSFTYELDSLKSILSEYGLKTKKSLVLSSPIEPLQENYGYSQTVHDNPPCVLCALAEKVRR
jgi:SAM-dependent methyltransferase